MEQLLSNKYDQLCDTLLIIEKYVGDLASPRTQMDIAVKLCPYIDNLKELVNNAETPLIIIETIAHDYNGLREDDEDFLPRLA
jgi:hypothetical protein